MVLEHLKSLLLAQRQVSGYGYLALQHLQNVRHNLCDVMYPIMTFTCVNILFYVKFVIAFIQDFFYLDINIKYTIEGSHIPFHFQFYLCFKHLYKIL
jgi:hypothetical protein